jgi:hypothetical protein
MESLLDEETSRKFDLELLSYEDTEYQVLQDMKLADFLLQTSAIGWETRRLISKSRQVLSEKRLAIQYNYEHLLVISACLQTRPSYWADLDAYARVKNN